MEGIEATLLKNKQIIVSNIEDYKVIGSENNATNITVHFPTEYENYSKRVDFKNIKNEKWTIGLYTPEFDEYSNEDDKNNFTFTLPSEVTIRGELKVQFIAYIPGENPTYVPFEILKVEVKEDILYCKKIASDNPDLLIKSYALSTEALETANKTMEIVDTLSVSSEELDCMEHVAVEIETDSETKHKNILFKIPAPKKGTSLRMMGGWDDATEYINDEFTVDVVSLHGCTYWCKQTHTNQEPRESQDTEYWGLLANKGSDAGVTIIDNLESTRADYVLSARQGNVLKGMLCSVTKKDLDDTETTINGIVLVEVDA